MTHATTRRRVIRLTGIATLPAATGCLGDGSEAGTAGETTPDGSPGELGTPGSHVDVEVTSIPNPSFNPDIVHIEEDGTVTWTVTDGRHDVTSYHPETYGVQRIPDHAEPWQSGILSEGSTYERSFEDPGVYDYVDTRTVCATHEVVGAIGRVVVGWPEGNQPGLEPPAASMPNMAISRIETLNERTHEVLGTTSQEDDR